MSDKRVGLVVAHDTHCGGSTGLLPPHGAKLDEGNVVLPNLFQEWAWERWEQAWLRAKQLTDDCTEVYVILNGDLVDGDHHGTWEIISANPRVQARICQESLSPMRDLQPDKVFVVRGTSAHTGEQSTHEEEIAEKIGAEKDESGNHSRYKLYADILGHRIQAYHHGKLGASPWTEQSALQRLAWAIRAEHDRAGSKPPDIVFVAHRHKWGDSGQFCCPTRVLMAPGWQGAGQYVHKNVVGAGIVQVGMWVAVLEEEVEPVVVPITFKPMVPKVEKLV